MLGRRFFLIVSLFVEHHEQDEILKSSPCKHQRGRLGKCTSEENGLKSVEKDEDKLNELDCCNVFLPPEILLHPGPEGGTHVVEVHDGVNTYDNFI